MEKKYMTISEAAKYSGLSKWTLYRLSSRREIPIFKIGSRVLFKIDEFDKWIQKFKCRLNTKGENFE